jgi:hypothetical protein
LEIRILTLSEFASEFERISKVPWRIPAEELRSLRRKIGETQDQLDDDLKRLFASVSASAAHPTMVEELSEPSAMLDTVELTKPILGGPFSRRPSVSVEAMEDVEASTEIIELSLSRSGELRSRSGGLEIVSDDEVGADLPVVELLPLALVELTDEEAAAAAADPVRTASEGPVSVPRSVGGFRESIITSQGGHPVSAQSGGPNRSVEFATNETLRGLEQKSQEVLAGLSDRLDSEERATDSESRSKAPMPELLSGEFPRRRSQQLTPATSVSAVLASEISQTGMRISGETANSLGRRVRPQARTTGAQMAVHTPRGIGTGSPAGARPPHPTPRPVPTVGEYLGSELTGQFGTMEEIVEHLGEPVAATTAAIELALRGLEEVEVRDEVAQELVETLSLVYPTVLVLRLKLPRLVVWEGILSTGGDRPTGFSFEVQEKSVWHRVASEGSHFAGTLPMDGPLRRHLPRAIGSATLVVPLQMGGRVVGVLVLDAGATGRLEPPGADIGKLCESFEVALRRVIVKRKNLARPV